MALAEQFGSTAPTSLRCWELIRLYPGIWCPWWVGWLEYFYSSQLLIATQEEYSASAGERSEKGGQLDIHVAVGHVAGPLSLGGNIQREA